VVRLGLRPMHSFAFNGGKKDLLSSDITQTLNDRRVIIGQIPAAGASTC